MESKKDLFQLPPDIHYLNGAYMSPMLKSVEQAGIQGIIRKRNPAEIKPVDFFSGQEEVKMKFGKLVNCKASQVAIIPSVSYGLNSAIVNIPVNSGKHAIIVAEDFPSDYYTLAEWTKENNKELKIIKAPEPRVNRGQRWTENIIENIVPETCAVVMSAIHWTDGTKYDLKKIGIRCKEMNALFIVDGTQSVGALPMDIEEFKIDALVCSGYKWLLGPYSIGLAYYSEFFDTGKPIEHSWMNKSQAEDFTRLADYTDMYKPGASRFNVGESSNFILLSMLSTALDHLLTWQVDSIQNYCAILIRPLIHQLRKNKFWVEDDKFRANHLFGFILPKNTNRETFLGELEKNKIIVSVRGDAIRVSPNVYNTADDIEALTGILKN